MTTIDLKAESHAVQITVDDGKHVSARRSGDSSHRPITMSEAMQIIQLFSDADSLGKNADALSDAFRN